MDENGEIQIQTSVGETKSKKEMTKNKDDIVIIKNTSSLKSTSIKYNYTITNKESYHNQQQQVKEHSDEYSSSDSFGQAWQYGPKKSGI